MACSSSEVAPSVFACGSEDWPAVWFMHGEGDVRELFGDVPDALGVVGAAQWAVEGLLGGGAGEAAESVGAVELAAVGVGGGRGVEGGEYGGLDGAHDAQAGQGADHAVLGGVLVASQLGLGGEQVGGCDAGVG